MIVTHDIATSIILQSIFFQSVVVRSCTVQSCVFSTPSSTYRGGCAVGAGRLRQPGGDLQRARRDRRQARTTRLLLPQDSQWSLPALHLLQERSENSVLYSIRFVLALYLPTTTHRAICRVCVSVDNFELNDR